MEELLFDIVILLIIIIVNISYFLFLINKNQKNIIKQNEDKFSQLEMNSKKIDNLINKIELLELSQKKDFYDFVEIICKEFSNMKDGHVENMANSKLLKEMNEETNKLLHIVIRKLKKTYQ